MIVLNADERHIKLFNKVIQAMGGQVIWGGHFYLLDDQLVLDGAIRSLCLSFESRKAKADLIDLPGPQKGALELSEHPMLSELLSMAVYVFAAWGQLPGVRFRQDLGQINGLLAGALEPYQLETDFREESFLLHKAGKWVTFEAAAKEILKYESAADGAPFKNELFLRLPEFIQFSDESSFEDGAKADASKDKKDAPKRDSRLVEERIEKFHARIHVLDRLSERQIFQLTRDIKNDKLLTAEEKEELYFPIEDYEFQKKMYQIEKGFSEGRRRTYSNIQKLKENLEKEDLNPRVKQRVMEKLDEMRIRCGEQEIRQIMSDVPEYVEYAQYQELMSALAPYEDIDLSPYEDRLSKMRGKFEIKEISNMLFQSPKKSREDYISLLKDIEAKGFSRENASPYIERILDNVREFDKKKLAGVMQRVPQMDFETAAGIYERLEQESVLPDLKESVMAALTKRLTQIRMAECVMLVQKLREIAAAVKFSPSERHYFYPVEQLIKKTADPRVQKLFLNAMAVYAQERGTFEYPLFLVDTSKNADGGEGMLLTPENLFYSTRLSGYKVSIQEIKSLHESGGLLNHKLLLEEVNGVRHKLPAAVAAEELSGWEKALKQFIRYLQGRKPSDKLKYKNKEDICVCRRCGCVYNVQESCPECGFRRE